MSDDANTDVSRHAAGVEDRWPKYDRHGRVVAEAILMRREDWEAIPHDARPAAMPSASTRWVYFLADPGWEPPQPAPPPRPAEFALPWPLGTPWSASLRPMAGASA